MRRLFVLLSIMVFVVSMSFAQSDRGTITGTISDPTSAVIPGANVAAINSETGVRYETISTETGNYTLGQLPAGVYQLSVELPGFKKYSRQGITVLVAQTLRIDVRLDVGAATDEVTVSADAPLLRTESSEVSHNVAAKIMDDLPILGIGGTQSGSAGIRNPYAMVNLIPGTAWVPNSNVRVNGAPSNTQSFRLEGQEASNTGTPGVQAQNQPSVDAIQEVAIQTSNFAAEYGQVGGGLFNVTMKSGTNQLHGTVYDYFVNEVLNAGNPFTENPSNPRGRARRNDYGFTVGGPVYLGGLYDGRNKTFFFFNWEEFREKTTINNLFQTVPIADYRNGDFRKAITSRLIGVDPAGRQMFEGMIYDPATTKTASDGRIYRDPFPNNIIPRDRWDSIAAKIQALFPAPSGPYADGLANNFLNPNVQNTRVTNIPSIKVDQVLGKGKISFFWQRTKTENPNGNAIFGSSDGLPDPITTLLGTFDTAPTYRLNYDYTVSPRILLHLGAGYRSNYFLVPSVTTKGDIPNYDAEKELGLRGGITHQFFPPMSGLLATNGSGGMRNFGSSAYANAITQSPSYNATLNWVRDNHSYKLGSEFRTEGYPPDSRGGTAGSYTFAADTTGQPFQMTAVGGANVGFGYASFLLGLAKGISISNPTHPRMGKKQLGLYAQDSWKVTRRLTLDYGLRYDFSTYLRETYGRAAEFSPTTIHPILGILGAAIYDGSGPNHCNCDIAHNYPYAFGPRFGMAYQVLPKTVFRLGLGVVYGGTAVNNNAAGGLASSTASTTASFSQWTTTLSDGIPVSFRPRPWPVYDAGFYPTSAPTPGTSPVWMDPNAGRPPRQVQWSVGFQREVGPNLVVETAYVGNRGVWWQAPAMLNLNANTPDRLLNVFGLDINKKDDRDLLTGPMSSPLVAARGFKAPYPGFPGGQSLAQALRPFPQFGNIPVYWNPMGRTWYDSLQVKVTKRFSQGLSFLSTFTWSKSLTIGSEIGEPNPGTTGGAVVNNVFNRYQNKYISSYDQPFLWNMSLSYTTPKLGGNRLLSKVLGDWTYGAFLQYASGMPLQVPNAQNNLNNILFQGSSFANRKPGVPLFTAKDLNCHCYDPNRTFVLNKDAWEDPADGTFGVSPAYYSDYRKQRRPIENMNFGRTFRITEKMTFNIRVEFTNVFNRAFWADPAGTNLTNAKLAEARQCKPGQAPQTACNADPTDVTTAGFGKAVTTGFTTTQNLYPRQGLIVGRFTF